MDQKPFYGWDETKRAANLAKHKVDFTSVEDFDWDYALVEIDDREDYGELREIAWGFIGERLHVLVFVRREELIRVISLRKAEPRDARKYAEGIKFE